MAVLCLDLYPTLFPHSPIDRQKGKWEQTFDAKIYGIVWVDSASNDHLSFWSLLLIPPKPVPDPDLELGRGEGRSSRPRDKGEARSPKSFSTLRAS